MDIKSLQIFQLLARSLHFSKTATAHHMSPSTLSRLIQRMEQQLNCQLLIRDNRSVNLTEAGKNFLKYCDQQIEQWNHLQQQIKQTQTELTGSLKIFCSVTAAYSHLPPLLDRFRQQNPKVEIILATGDPADAMSQLKQKSVDIAIAAKPDTLSNKVNFQTIAEVPLSVIAPKFTNEIRHSLQNSPVNWQNIPIILSEHGPARERFNQWFKTQSKGKPTIYATVSGHEALVSMVALGCGIGIAPKVVVENSPVRNRVEYIENLGEIQPFQLGICCNQAERNHPIVNAFSTLYKLNSKE
jgi:LysR family transcriptional regulator, positive regulator for ilvC